MKSKQPVWDLPVRLLHWALVASIATAWWSRHQTGPVHEVAGYTAAAVVLLRLLWSFAGNRYARLSGFVRAPRATLAYARQLRAGAAPRFIGHNPLGGWMVVALMAAILLLAGTGWSLDTDLLWGYAWPVQVHTAIGWCLLGMVGAHLAGVLASSVLHRENLVAAMFSGRKRLPAPGDVD